MNLTERKRKSVEADCSYLIAYNPNEEAKIAEDVANIPVGHAFDDAGRKVTIWKHQELFGKMINPLADWDAPSSTKDNPEQYSVLERTFFPKKDEGTSRA